MCEHEEKISRKRKLRAFGFALGLAFVITGALICGLPSERTAKSDRVIYEEMLRNFIKLGYNFSLPQKNYTGKIVILVHDVDFSYEGAETLVSVERQFNIKSCFYLRPDAFYFTQSIPYFQELEREGWEIGFQYDCLSRANNNTEFAMQLWSAQLTYMRAFFTIKSTDYHGDSYNLSISNYQLYEHNKVVWEEKEVFELYALQNFSYITDTDAHLIIPETFTDIVLVQLHTDWW
jgi:hypothetical protein